MIDPDVLQRAINTIGSALETLRRIGAVELSDEQKLDLIVEVMDDAPNGTAAADVVAQLREILDPPQFREPAATAGLAHFLNLSRTVDFLGPGEADGSVWLNRHNLGIYSYRNPHPEHRGWHFLLQNGCWQLSKLYHDDDGPRGDLVQLRDWPKPSSNDRYWLPPASSIERDA